MTAPIMAVALALAFSAAPLPQEERETLNARIYDTVGLTEDQRETMLRVAGEALSPAGIRMDWMRCLEPSGLDCPPRPGRDLIVRIVERHGGDDGGSCGFAMVAGGKGFVSLSQDCARRTLASLERRWLPLDLEPLSAGEVLGHMLAHEIAHVLLPGSEHSLQGLFKARLHARDWKTVRRQGLRFIDSDIARLRDAASLATVSPPPQPSRGAGQRTRTPATRSHR
jgi:hypothetical protein